MINKKKKHLDGGQLAILANRFEGVSSKMGNTLLRTGRSGVLNRAKESEVGEVFVATADNEIINIVKEYGGQAILTKHDHLSGSDRVYEAYLKQLKDKVNLIINDIF